MSRHEFTSQQTDGTSYECTVGWDRPLNTFFAQVFEFAPGESTSEKILLWLGTSYSEIQDANAVTTAIQPYCTVPPELALRLEQDRMVSSGTTDSDLQTAVRKMFEK